MTNYFLLPGGTVDVTVHEVLDGGKLKELYKASGGAWGGNKINEMYEDFLRQMVGVQVINKVKNEHMCDWMSMLRDFERIKRTLSTLTVLDDIVVKVECCINDAYKNFHGISLQEAFELNKVNYRQGSVLRKKTRLQIPRTVIMNWVETVSRNVKAHVKKLLGDLANISFVVMVGGFSNSPILQEEIKSIVGNIAVFVPEEAELSIVKGAVLFGWNPRIITARRSKYTYGTKIHVPFVESDHSPERKKIDEDGAPVCLVFDKFVEEMQEVEIGDVFEKTYCPTRRNQTAIDVDVYYSPSKSPLYTDEPGCRYLGNLKVPMPVLNGGTSRKVNVCVKFGQTELHIDAEEVTSGKKFDTSFAFFRE